MRLLTVSSLMAFSILILVAPTPVKAQVARENDLVEVVVLRHMLSTVPQHYKDIGVEKSKVDLKSLQAAFGPGKHLITISAYIRQHPNPSDAEPCYWIRVANRTPGTAVVECGQYPLPYMTKRGQMYLYTTDYEFHLMKMKGRWKIVSSEITGES